MNSKNIKKEIKPYVHIVNYWETDQMGVVHHSNYIKWLEEARCHFLREIGCPYSKIEEDGYMLPVYELEIKYKNPVKFEDVVNVFTNIKEISELKLILSYKIYSNNNLICIAKTVHPWTDKNLKIKKLNSYLFDQLRLFSEN